MALLGSNSQTIGSDWEPWGLWSDCSVTCGSGEMVRTRACGSGTPSNCQGDSTQQEICTKAKCPNAGDEWGTWEQWSTCSKDCNGGKRKRERQCTDGNGGKGKKCTGDDKEEEKCNQQDCVKVDGEWEAWGQWSDCSKICNKGKRKRERTCFKTKGSKKKDCSGSKDEEEYCNEQKCPHPDGTWEDWGTWSACSKSCGKGKRERTRKCFSSVPGNGYGLCKPGKPDEEEYCNDTPCPKAVDEWGTWEQWSTCSKDCNGGKRKRERQCTDGNGGKGKKCTGDDKEEEKCNQQDCVKVDGEWEAWGQWSDCSKICNKGKRKRERTCFKTKGSKKKDCSGSKDEEEYCNEQKCPHPDGTWEDWGTWSACSKSCGKGKRERTRKCFSSVPGNGYGLCKPGKPDEEEYCNDTPCPKAVDEWGTWEQWSTCSKDCNGGKRKRERQCTDGNGGKGKKCTGDDKEEEKCNQQDCVKVDGEWEAWGQWSDCSKICNKGKRKRERTCFKTKGSKKKDCSGSKDEEEYCNEQKCPHPDGTWEDWGTWSACSKSCGKGKRERTRKCFSSVPGNGYGLCKPGKPDEEEYCNDTPCPKAVDEWGTWEQWSTCSKDCNGGKRKRERQCTDGNGGKGKKCTGDDKEEEKCNQQDCVKVDGEWEAWGQWSDCSKICNKGKRKRERTCFKTKGSKKNDCSGSKDEEEYCNEQKCPHPDGTWEDWGTWSACSKSCGKGKRERTRKCFSSVPGNGYGLCKPGKPDEEEYCNDTPCPKAVDEWGTWEQWSTCSKDCNGGKRKRERQCTDGNGGKGKKCTGDDKEEEKCNQQDCVKVDGEWETWGQWSDCSKICNKGKRKRERTCFKTKGSKKNDCSGSKDEEEYCNEQKCPHPDGTWEDWGTWSACSKSCGKGKRERTRKCFSSVPGNGYGLCKPGKPDEEEYCNDTPCPKAVDEWGTWEQWSTCSKDCNGGKRKRERQCTDGNGGKGKKCTGDDKEEEKCNQQDCVKVDGEWEAWGQWSDCSKICNKGKRKRERTCFKTKGSKKNDCSGSKDEEEYCNEQKCPHPDGTWEDWGTWSACSKSCGKGKRERTRKCFSSVPGNGYGLCKPGKPDEEEYCNDTPCPKAVDEWGTWEQWSTCSKDCNGGKRKRERQCTDGNGGKGKKCTGDDKEEEKCNQQDCVKVDGEWETWGQWSDCSKICNKGKRKRERTCFKTKGSKKNDCSGSKDEEEYCNEQKCPHPDGTWEDWGTWSACSKSCGKGKRERTRKCFSSVPGNGYGLCKPGKPDEEEYCNDTPCPKAVDEWGTWEQWSTCSKDCNGGKRKRERQCTDGNGGKGKKCTGDDKEEEKCNQQDCVKVDGEWEAWGQWSDCSKICNKGKRKRERTCFKTKGSKKNDCSGSKDEEEYCNEQKCPHPDGTWEDWGTWSACSKSCGKGKRERTRKCFSSVPGNGYGLCKPGKPDEEEYCNDTPCPKAVDEWGTWEQWSTCSKDCNGGKRKRERQCTDGNGGKGKKCTGDDKEEEKCNQQDCVKVDGEWETWGQWSDCSKICNKGKRKRERTCFKTKGSKKNDCSGSKDEEEYCNEQKCPHPDGTWEDWGTWSACSKSCGKGKRERTRKCFSSVPGNGYGLCKPGKPDEEEYCNDTPCPKAVDEWGTWEQWSTCSKDCNGGKRKRERQCTDGNGGKGKKCTGDDKEEEKCNQQDCVKVDGEWEAWGQWSDCSKICNKGKRKRERTCFKTKGSKKKDCSGSKDEEEYCNEQKCPLPDGTWEDWGTWSACSKSCGKGKRERTRKCFSSVPGNGYGLCKPGKPDEEEYCNDTPCPKAPINGGFSAWSTWTSCSKTCGSGKMTRTRLCNNPAPSNGGTACSGDQSEENICNTQACPVAINGGFSDWSTWGACSKTCGSGKKTRTRSCTNPAPSNGGAACSGDRSQEDTCNTQTCPVAINGGFSDWSTWGACSKTCGSGKKTRTRSCTNPVPSNGGSACSGDSSQEDTCNTQACPVAINGGFSDWSTWGACSKTCGSGKKTRTRSCTNPAPSNGGAACSGDRSQEDTCNTQTCPVAINGGFSDWSTWGACSKTCGSGKKTRTRSCTNPAPSNGGAACSGDSSQEDTCNTQACPVAINGGFSDWSTWGACSKTCGSGKKTRTRSCTNPVPSNGGSACSGDSSQEDTCNSQACPVAINDGFSDWSTWGACSKTCGSGKKSRTRSCTNPAPSNGGAACSGDSSQEDICNTQACPGPVNGGYSNWSAWSSCTKPCGSGKMTRKRTCDNPAPSNGGAPCSGDDTQESDCNTQKCKQDNTWEDWEAWSSCSKTCGGGRRSRTRNCYTSTPGLALGRCKGKKEEKETCNAQACPVVDGAWEDWSAWSKCSKTCGGGKQLRSRQCNNPRPSNGGKKCIGSTLEFQQCGNRTCPAKGTAVGTHTHRCPQGWYQCYSGTISCILEEFLCDCQNDCDDGSDEDTILASCDSEAKLMCFSAATDIHPQYLTVTVLMVSLALLFRWFR